ncbi:MAG: heavy metal translocating P-type ATPase [Clostridia bacterium]|nr:heavy metal translocating P-type ATPase [Clostridia bacterium]
MKKFDVTGMSCSACSAHVEKSVRGVEGVTDVNVNLLSNSMTVEFAEPATVEAIISAVEKGGYGASLVDAEKTNATAAPKKDAGDVLKRLIVSAVLLLPLMYMTLGGPVPAALEKPVLMGIVQFLLALPVIYLNRSYYFDGFKTLLHGAPNMSSLIAVGSSAGLLYSIWTLLRTAYLVEAGQHAMAMYHFESSAMILTLITLGKYLEARAKDHTSDAISRLVDMTPKRATVLRDGVETEIDAAELRVGDICVVRDGGAVPADGIIEEGHGSIDMSMLTGESLPAELGVGDEVTGATVNKEGYFKFRVTRVGEDTSFSRIIKLVEEAASSKAPVSRLVDRVSGIFVPIVMSIAAVTFAGWMFAGGGFERALQAAISVLVVSCPCALGLATPTAIMVGTGRGAELGIMIKSAAALEMASHIKVAAFDKTGTLTEGGMKVVAVTATGDEKQLKRLAGAVEALSSHPIAKAITEYAGSVPVATDYESVPGMGVRGVCEGHQVAVGTGAWLKQLGADASGLEKWAEKHRAEGATAMYVAIDGKTAGAFALADTLRQEGERAVRELSAMGVKTVMLTGDNEVTARAIAKKLGLDDVRAGLLPGDKEAAIAELQKEGPVMMVGDGINDAPALTRSDMGVAVAQGTDVAIESADCVLVRDNPALAAGAVALGRATMTNIKQNLFWACIYNGLMIPIAAGVLSGIGINMNPMIAAAAMSLSSLCVVTNALKLRKFRFDAGETVRCAENICNVTIEEAKEEEKTMKKTIKIDGMMCPRCVAHVKKALDAIGVENEVILEKNCAIVDAAADNDAIKAAITDAGYDVVGIEE